MRSSSILMLSKFWRIFFPFFFINIVQLFCCPNMIFVMIRHKLRMTIFWWVCFRRYLLFCWFPFNQVLWLLINNNFNWLSVCQFKNLIQLFWLLLINNQFYWFSICQYNWFVRHWIRLLSIVLIIIIIISISLIFWHIIIIVSISIPIVIFSIMCRWVPIKSLLVGIV